MAARREERRKRRQRRERESPDENDFLAETLEESNKIPFSSPPFSSLSSLSSSPSCSAPSGEAVDDTLTPFQFMQEQIRYLYILTGASERWRKKVDEEIYSHEKTAEEGEEDPTTSIPFDVEKILREERLERQKEREKQRMSKTNSAMSMTELVERIERMEEEQRRIEMDFDCLAFLTDHIYASLNDSSESLCISSTKESGCETLQLNISNENRVDEENETFDTFENFKEDEDFLLSLDDPVPEVNFDDEEDAGAGVSGTKKNDESFENDSKENIAKIYEKETMEAEDGLEVEEERDGEYEETPFDLPIDLTDFDLSEGEEDEEDEEDLLLEEEEEPENI